MISLQQLQSLVASGEIDTVVIALTDMQGRLMGKHVTADFFVNEVIPHGAEGCNYLMAVDTDMKTVEGYALTSWASGYGDFVMKPDLNTLRLAPWLEKTALVQCDLEDHAGVEQIRVALDRLLGGVRERVGLVAKVGQLAPEGVGRRRLAPGEVAGAEARRQALHRLEEQVDPHGSAPPAAGRPRAAA